jgi:AraC-like DNA-binding protein
MEAPFYYYEFDPAPPLARHVTSYWAFRVRGAAPLSHRLWPDGCISLVWILPAGGRPFAVLEGPHLRAHDVPVEPGTAYWGARFWPDAGGAVAGIAASELRDVSVPAPLPFRAGLDALAAEGSDVPEARAAAALDAMLLPLVRAARPLDDAVRRAVLAIVAARGDAPVAAVAAGIGLGERQIQRRFRTAVGLTPKQFARIRRLREAAAGVLAPRQPAWAAVAAELGYADQSHLIHEFSQLTGLTPVAFEDRLRRIEHGRIQP